MTHMKPTPPPWPDPKDLVRRAKKQGFDGYESDAHSERGGRQSQCHAHGKGGDHEGQFPPCCFCRLNLNTEPLDKSQVLWHEEDSADANKFVDDLRHKLQMQVKRSQAYMEFMSKDMPALNDWIVSRRQEGPNYTQHWSESSMVQQVKASNNLALQTQFSGASSDANGGWSRQMSGMSAMSAGGWSRQESGMSDLVMRTGTAKFAGNLEAVPEPDSSRPHSPTGSVVSGYGGGSPRAGGRDHPMQQAPVAVSVPQNYRRALIMALFEGLDDSGSHLLGFSEMRTYAELTGFSGDDDDWMTEYTHLCEENSWNRNIGAHAGQFSTMIEDPNNRCYASNEALNRMLTDLRRVTGRDIRIPEPDTYNRLISNATNVTEVEQPTPMQPMESFAPSKNHGPPQAQSPSPSPSFSGHGGDRGVLEVTLPAIVKGASNSTQSFLQRMMAKDLEFQQRKASIGG